MPNQIYLKIPQELDQELTKFGDQTLRNKSNSVNFIVNFYLKNQDKFDFSRRKWTGWEDGSSGKKLISFKLFDDISIKFNKIAEEKQATKSLFFKAIIDVFFLNNFEKENDINKIIQEKNLKIDQLTSEIKHLKFELSACKEYKEKEKHDNLMDDIRLHRMD